MQILFPYDNCSAKLKFAIIITNNVPVYFIALKTINTNISVHFTIIIKTRRSYADEKAKIRVDI